MAPDAEKLARKTFEDWLTANSTDEVARSFYRFIASGVLAAESWELSLLHVLFYIRSNGMLDNLLSTTGGNQERRVVGGAHRISERMLQELGAEAVRLGARVHTIAQHDDAVGVGYDEGQVLADRVIVALPPTLAGRLRYQPPLPARRDGLTQQVPMGCAILFQAIYPTPFWRDDGLSGEVFSFDGPLPAMFDGSPPDGSFGALVGVFGGDYAGLAAEQAAEVRRKLVLDSLTKFFGPMAAEPLEYLEKDWMAEEFTRGCFGGHFGVGVWTRYGKALIEPVGRIHWAGTETADVSNGYMDGAVRSGHRAASEALDSLS
jgi:monoamine oxidase